METVQVNSAVGIAAITGGVSKWDDGTSSAPSIAFAAQPGFGFYRVGTGLLALTNAGTLHSAWTTTAYSLPSTLLLQWTNGADPTSGVDTKIGRQSAGLPVINGATATPAGGAATMGLVFGSTAGFGVYIGSGVPTLSAAKGSLYLRSDGSTTNDRFYINTNGTTGWTAGTTAA